MDYSDPVSIAGPLRTSFGQYVKDLRVECEELKKHLSLQFPAPDSPLSRDRLHIQIDRLRVYAQPNSDAPVREFSGEFRRMATKAIARRSSQEALAHLDAVLFEVVKRTVEEKGFEVAQSLTPLASDANRDSIERWLTATRFISAANHLLLSVGNVRSGIDDAFSLVREAKDAVTHGVSGDTKNEMLRGLDFPIFQHAVALVELGRIEEARRVGSEMTEAEVNAVGRYINEAAAEKQAPVVNERRRGGVSLEELSELDQVHENVRRNRWNSLVAFTPWKSRRLVLSNDADVILEVDASLDELESRGLSVLKDESLETVTKGLVEKGIHLPNNEVKELMLILSTTRELLASGKPNYPEMQL